ncbi:MAG TPA: hypothetical protein VII50_10735 [Acidothermaceae bacterium]
MVDVGQRATNGDHASVKVDVLPRQSDRLAATQSAHPDEVPHRVQVVGRGEVEELPVLRRRPHSHPVTFACAFPFGDPLGSPHDCARRIGVAELDVLAGVAGDHLSAHRLT